MQIGIWESEPSLGLTWFVGRCLFKNINNYCCFQCVLTIKELLVTSRNEYSATHRLKFRNLQVIGPLVLWESEKKIKKWTTHNALVIAYYLFAFNILNKETWFSTWTKDGKEHGTWQLRPDWLVRTSFTKCANQNWNYSSESFINTSVWNNLC